jgi:hypothetical protein
VTERQARLSLERLRGASEYVSEELQILAQRLRSPDKNDVTIAIVAAKLQGLGAALAKHTHQSDLVEEAI